MSYTTIKFEVDAPCDYGWTRACAKIVHEDVVVVTGHSGGGLLYKASHKELMTLAVADALQRLKKMAEDVEARVMEMGLAKVESVPESGCVAWPKEYALQYNSSGEPCDMRDGPCSCGAWHKGGK